jgi:hypothetical protein
LPLKSFIARLPQSRTIRVPGTAVFMTSQADFLPGALLRQSIMAMGDLAAELRRDGDELAPVGCGDVEFEATELRGILAAAALEGGADLERTQVGETGVELFQAGNGSGYFSGGGRGAGLQIEGKTPLAGEGYFRETEAREHGGELFAAHGQVPDAVEHGPAGGEFDFGIEQRLDVRAADER